MLCPVGDRKMSIEEEVEEEEEDRSLVSSVKPDRQNRGDVSNAWPGCSGAFYYKIFT